MKNKIVIMAMVLCCVMVLCACASEPNGNNGTATQSPAVTSPSAEPAVSPQQTNDGGAATNPGNTMMNIPNFAEGTEVGEADIPEIVAALQEVHEGATITRISHATYMEQQTYCVEYSDQDGTVQVAYIGADGSILVDNLSEPISAGGATDGNGSDTAGGAAGGAGVGGDTGTGTNGGTGSTGSGNGNAA